MLKGRPASLEWYFFPYFGQKFGSFLWSTHGHHVLNFFFCTFFTSGFHRGFKHQVFLSSRFLVVDLTKKLLHWILTLHATVIPIYFHYFIIKQVSLLYLSLTLSRKSLQAQWRTYSSPEIWMHMHISFLRYIDAWLAWHFSGPFITTVHRRLVTFKGGLERESPPKSP